MAKKHGLVIDLERCIGCHTCTIACKMEHHIKKGSGIRVETIGGLHRDTPRGEHPQLSMHFLPVPCMHCDEPPCIDACPVEAIYKGKDGIVLVDSEECNGCEECIPACPYEAIIFDEEKEIARKCTLCSHRIDEELEPFCVVCCEADAIYFGDLNDPGSKTMKLIEERKAKVIKQEAGTKPAVYYCPTRQGQIE